MKPEDRLKQYPRYPSIKGEFCYELYKAMAKDEKITLITGDLGYGQFDPHKEDFPDRFVNTGAAEQAMMGIAVGLALHGFKPFVYTITNFLLYRPFEWVRNYVNHESIPVRLVAGGLGLEYADDGFTHQNEDLPEVLSIFRNILQLFPTDIKEVPGMVEKMVKEDKPWFIGLPRK